MFCDVLGKQDACERCGFRHPGFPIRRVCRTRDELDAEASGYSLKDAGPAATPELSAGPGTELKALLAGWPFRIVATADCKCTSRANYMDAKGCDWCESPEGMAEIMAFLREAAEERGLPFLDVAARLLVRRAIANARKAEARRAKEAEQAAAEGPAA